MSWLPLPQLAVSLWWALKMTLHRGHVAAATLPHLISTWTHLLPWPGALYLMTWPRLLSLWMSQCMLVSSPQTLGLRAALQSWLQPPRLKVLVRSAEGVTSWKGLWPSSVAQGAAAVCRALTHQAGMVVCMAQPMPAATMTQRWRIQTWRGSYRDSGRSKQVVYLLVFTWKYFVI